MRKADKHCGNFFLIIIHPAAGLLRRLAWLGVVLAMCSPLWFYPCKVWICSHQLKRLKTLDPSDGDLVKLVFEKPEYHRLDRSEKEIVHQGTWYDVHTTHDHGDSVVVWALADWKETALFTSVFHTGTSNRRLPTASGSVFFLFYYFEPAPEWISVAIFRAQVVFSNQPLRRTGPELPLPTPPPERTFLIFG